MYGWGFFSVVILLLALAGLPFREDAPRAAPPAAAAPIGRERGAGAALLVAGLAVALAAVAPWAAALLDRVGAPPDLRLPGFVATEACHDLGDPPGEARRFTCDGVPLEASLRVLPRGAAPAMLRAARAAATDERDAIDVVVGVLDVDGVAPSRWRLVEAHEPERLTATAVWIGGAPLSERIADRLRLAWDGVTGGEGAAVLVAVALRPPALVMTDQRLAARRLLRDFIRGQAPLLSAIARATGQ
jgi:hypothetical protein